MKRDYYLGREYGVLPKWLQFIIFIHSGIFGGGGGKWRFQKLHRIKCWYGHHIYHPDSVITDDGKEIKINELVKNTCTRCGTKKI